MTLIGDQALPKGWSLSVAWRYATGKPFTPVTGATFDATTRRVDPAYGAPQSDRLPAGEEVRPRDLARHADLAATTSSSTSSRSTTCSIATNLYQYTYTPTTPAHSRAEPVQPLLYFGASLTHLQR